MPPKWIEGGFNPSLITSATFKRCVGPCRGTLAAVARYSIESLFPDKCPFDAPTTFRERPKRTGVRSEAQPVPRLLPGPCEHDARDTGHLVWACGLPRPSPMGAPTRRDLVRPPVRRAQHLLGLCLLKATTGQPQAAVCVSVLHGAAVVRSAEVWALNTIWVRPEEVLRA